MKPLFLRRPFRFGPSTVSAAGEGAGQGDTVLRIEGLTVRYGNSAEAAVKGVSLSVAAGEVLALVGESGSGKSTTADAILRLLPPQARIGGGALRVVGHDVLAADERLMTRIRGRHVGYVPQDPGSSLNPVETIGRQIIEMLEMHSDLAREELRPRAIEILQTAGLSDPETRLRQYPHELSGGMKQRVLIGIAMACRPRLLIADEPTSALDVTVQRRILDHLQALTETHGTSVLLITHDLGVARERADRIAVMHRGRIVEEGPAWQIIDAPADPYTQRLIASAPSLARHRPRASVRERPADAAATIAAAAPVLDVRHLTKDFDVVENGGQRRSFRAVDDVSFSVGQGETLALVGESGSGKSTSARLALRLIEPAAGSIRFDGKDITNATGRALKELRRQSQFVHQHPGASLDPKMLVSTIIGEPLRAFGGGSRREREARIRELADAVALPASVLSRRPRELSGGQQQRVAIARALALEPRLVVLDEAVSALDVTVQAQVLELLVEIQSRMNVSYLFISHDLAVVREIAHTVAVMQHGRVVESGPVAQIFEAPRAAYTRELLAAVPGQRDKRRVHGAPLDDIREAVGA